MNFVAILVLCMFESARRDVLKKLSALWENPVQLIKSEFLFLNTFLGLINHFCYVLIN